MLLFLNIYHQKYFDLLDFITRFVQTINLQIYYKHYEKDTITTIRMLIRRNKRSEEHTSELQSQR